MKKVLIITVVSIIVITAIVIGVLFINSNKETNIADEGNPEKILEEYFSYIEQENYEAMYNLVNLPENYTKEDYINRNKNIYEGIYASNIQINIKSVEKENGKAKITYDTKMNTSAGNIEFSNTVEMTEDENKEYKINWSSNLIFPELNNDYKVRVSKQKSQRGKILDRNGNVLAEQGNIANVGIVPGKLGENKDNNIAKLSKLLNISVETINNEISASWVKDDSFVPLKKISNDETELKEAVLEIAGVMIDYEEDRIYPYKEATSHITGYIQGITAEELTRLSEFNYTSSSVIGKTGVENKYENRLRGIDGTKIYIEDSEGNEIKTIASTFIQNGENIQLTIDVDLQLKLYNEMKDSEGLFVVMNPKTGEILALVSTPSYDPNKFILGMTNDEWNEISNSATKPLYTRFLESWCPGSTFKPITGAIGLTSGKLSENDEFTYSGLEWQKDSSWGNRKITTLTPYSGSKNLRNAIIYSDNIYFAQAALQIGADAFTKGLDKIMFNENIKFDLSVTKSQYSNSNTITSESILADSGYGQGEILVNPIHMASIYSAFVNDGNMVKPYLEYKENIQPEYLVENAFTKEAANTIKEDLIQVIETPGGTGHDVKINGKTLAGKTGTAQIDTSKGYTLGWFDCFTVDTSEENSVLIISMVENQSSVFLKSIIKELLQSM